MTPVRIGTRGSALAVTQTTTVAEALAELGSFAVELVRIKTEGDILKGSLAQIGGTGVFVAALREALLAETCDVAVHSLKDLPTWAEPGLSLASIPSRADYRDALCARDSLTLEALPIGARVGTGSPRRAAQLRLARADLDVVDIRGNVGTRLNRVRGMSEGKIVDGKFGDLDAVVLAAAGLQRLGRLEVVTELLNPSIMLPAPGQGALAVECREADASSGTVASAMKEYDDAATRLCVTAERSLLARLEAGCSAPIGALAQAKDGHLTLEAVVCSDDGKRSVRVSRTVDAESHQVGQALSLGIAVAEQLLAEGAGELTSLPEA
ncbi:hydroxymethylbilane synthase [Arthrobacter roseus]|uniref:hydroxymethylbilane synthase n=1 Tax=Arthrobacter roseus TaxID=136274 RepID=UPI0030840555|nr:hydroxymethylbilane synthase [Arthrobacter roseus]